MPWEPCKSGEVYTWGAQKGKRKGHNTKKEQDACEWCNPASKRTPEPATAANPSAPAAPKPAAPKAAAGTPQPATYAEGTAEVAPNSAAKRKAEEAKDYVIDGPHVLMWWNEVVFYWLGFVSDGLDKFVWKVPFHVDKTKLKISPFATRQLLEGNATNMYTRLTTRLFKSFFHVPTQAAADLAIEDAAFLSAFSGVLGAFGSHYFRISKESPRLSAWRAKRAAAKAEKAAKKAGEEEKENHE